jgi:arylesterase/paraoxonase
VSATRKALIALGFFTVVVGVYALKLLNDAGAFKTLNLQPLSDCEVVAEITGAEDLDWGLASDVYISADNRSEKFEAMTDPGAIWKIALNPTRVERLTQDLPFEFHPHGISVFRSQKGGRLLAVNHREQEDSVEVFVIFPDGLKHGRSIMSPALVTANDIAAVSLESFYVTNDHSSRRPWRQSIEAYTRQGQGNIVFFDGQDFQTVDSGLNFANGLWWSEKTGQLVLSEMLAKRLRVYRREAQGGIELQRTIDLESAPDNVVMDAEGVLWVGAHPQLLKLKKLSRDHRRTAPSQILRVKDFASDHPKVDSVFVDDGQQISAVSVALPMPVQRRLLMGSIYGSKILRCSLPR